jgi:hypothetical protein
MAESTDSQRPSTKGRNEAQGSETNDELQPQGVRKRRFRLLPLLTGLPVSQSFLYPPRERRRRNRKQRRGGERAEEQFDQEGGRCAEGFVGTRGGMTERGERNWALMAFSPFISLPSASCSFFPFS